MCLETCQVRISYVVGTPPDPLPLRQKIVRIAPTALNVRKCAEMATSVNGAFTAFRRDCVDLDPDQVKLARASRDDLQKQMSSLPSKESTFPALSGRYVAAGSFARRTMIQPLDDLEVFVIMRGGGMTARSAPGISGTYHLDPGSTPSPLTRLTDGSGHINSTRVLNTFKRALQQVASYDTADITRDGAAVRLKLVTSPWHFDIVPSVDVIAGPGGVGFFLMPNGQGAYRPADPQKESDASILANQRHHELMLPLIRLIMYWNKRPGCPTLPAYYLETIALKSFAFQAPLTSLPEGLKTFFQKAPGSIWAPCPDPKGLGPPLDEEIDWQTKQLVTTAMQNAAHAVQRAFLADQQGQTRAALNDWRHLFGSEFPPYG